MVHNATARLGDRLVLMVLAECADNETGTCYPSVASIAKRALLSERQTSRCLTNLAQAGLITIDRNASRYGTNIFTLSRSMLRGDRLSGGAISDQDGVTSATCFVSYLSPEQSVEQSEEQSEPNIKGASPKKSGSTEIPDDWTPTDKGMEFAEKHGMDPWAVPDQVTHFIAYHQARHNKMEWNAAWRTWCMNFPKWGQTQREPTPIRRHNAPKGPDFAARALELERLGR